MIVLFPGPSFRDICIHVQRHFPLEPAIVVADQPIRGQLSNGLYPEIVRLSDFEPRPEEVYTVVATSASLQDTLPVILRLIGAGATFRVCTTDAAQAKPGLYPWQIGEFAKLLGAIG